MTVSIKPSPIFRGRTAKKLIESLDKPSNNQELFKKCKEYSKIFKHVGDWPEYIPQPTDEDIKYLAELSKRSTGASFFKGGTD